MATRDQRRSAISQSEWAIMNALWDGGPMAVGDIHRRLSAEGQSSYATVKTLVRRLRAKGWVEYERVGSSFLYRPAVPRSEAVQKEIERFSKRVLDGLVSPLVAYFAESGSITQEDIEELEMILREHREGGGKGHDTDPGAC
jgi:predicted transcriptional regulator